MTKNGYGENDLPICRKIFQIADELRDRWLKSQSRSDMRVLMSLTLSQQRIIRTIWRMTEQNPQGIKLKELASQLFLSNGAVSTMIEEMVQRKLVERVTNPDDRRCVLIRMSESGREHTRIYEAFFQDIYADFACHLTPGKRRMFRETLDEFIGFLSSETNNSNNKHNKGKK